MVLTKVQHEILELLRDGGMMVFDERNVPSIGDRGNGLVISDRGLDVLAAQRPAKKRSPRIASFEKAPTERQLGYPTLPSGARH